MLHFLTIVFGLTTEVDDSFRMFLIYLELSKGYWVNDTSNESFYFPLPYDMHGMTDRSEL